MPARKPQGDNTAIALGASAMVAMPPRVTVSVVGDLPLDQVVARLLRAAREEQFVELGEPQVSEVRYRVSDGAKIVSWWAAGYR